MSGFSDVFSEESGFSTIPSATGGVTAVGPVLGVLLKSDDGVQAHIRMKASTKRSDTVFCFTAAKLHIFEELKELKELKGVKHL
jgi:hypothetical protein